MTIVQDVLKKLSFLIFFIVMSCATENVPLKDGGLYISIDGLNPANISQERLDSDAEFKENYEACISWWVVFKHLQPFVCKIGKACFMEIRRKCKRCPCGGAGHRESYTLVVEAREYEHFET